MPETGFDGPQPARSDARSTTPNKPPTARAARFRGRACASGEAWKIFHPAKPANKSQASNPQISGGSRPPGNRGCLPVGNSEDDWAVVVMVKVEVTAEGTVGATLAGEKEQDASWGRPVLLQLNTTAWLNPSMGATETV